MKYIGKGNLYLGPLHIIDAEQGVDRIVFLIEPDRLVGMLYMRRFVFDIVYGGESMSLLFYCLGSGGIK